MRGNLVGDKEKAGGGDLVGDKVHCPVAQPSLLLGAWPAPELHGAPTLFLQAVGRQLHAEAVVARQLAQSCTSALVHMHVVQLSKGQARTGSEAGRTHKRAAGGLPKELTLQPRRPDRHDASASRRL